MYQAGPPVDTSKKQVLDVGSGKSIVVNSPHLVNHRYGKTSGGLSNDPPSISSSLWIHHSWKAWLEPLVISDDSQFFVRKAWLSSQLLINGALWNFITKQLRCSVMDPPWITAELCGFRQSLRQAVALCDELRVVFRGIWVSAGPRNHQNPRLIINNG